MHLTHKETLLTLGRASRPLVLRFLLLTPPAMCQLRSQLKVCTRRLKLQASPRSSSSSSSYSLTRGVVTSVDRALTLWLTYGSFDALLSLSQKVFQQDTGGMGKEDGHPEETMQFLSPFGPAVLKHVKSYHCEDDHHHRNDHGNNDNNVNGNNTSSYVLMATLVSFSTTPLSSVARLCCDSGRYTPMLERVTRALLTTARRRLLPKGQLDPEVGLALVTYLSCALLNHLKDTTSSLPHHNDHSPSPSLWYWSHPYQMQLLCHLLASLSNIQSVSHFGNVVDI